MKRVYFIKPVGMDGPIKIGRSANPEARRALLEISSPFNLEIIAIVEGDAYLERRFHALFHAHHLRNEWFSVSAEISKVIAQIKSGDFDASTLPQAVYLPRPARAQLTGAAA